MLELNRQQAAFVAAFWSGPPVHVLAAPAGSGKTTLAVHLVADGLSRGEVADVVVCASRPQLEWWARNLREAVPALAVVTVTPAECRLRNAKSPAQPWGAGTAALLDWSLLRDRYVPTIVAKHTWSLFVAEMASDGLQIMSGMLEKLPARRKLFLTQPHSVSADKAVYVPPGGELTQWNAAAPVAERDLRGEVLAYAPTPPESAALDAALRLEAHLAPEVVRRLSIREAAGASLAALRNAIMRVPSTVVQTPAPPGGDDAMVTALQWMAPCLSALDEVTGEAKLEALLARLNATRPAKVVVFAADSATASYLHAALDGYDGEAVYLGGQADAASVLAAYAERARYLVVWDRAMQGFEFPATNLVVHYDLPTREWLNVRASRFPTAAPRHLVVVREGDVEAARKLREWGVM